MRVAPAARVPAGLVSMPARWTLLRGIKLCLGLISLKICTVPLELLQGPSRLCENIAPLALYAVPQLVGYVQPQISASLRWEIANGSGYHTRKK